MAFAYVDRQNNNATTTTITITKPTWTTDWDIMFCHMSSWDWYITTYPSWWTLLAQNTYWSRYVSLFYRVASSEPTNYVFGNSWTTTKSYSLVTYRWWFDISNPIKDISNQQYTTDDSNIVAQNISAWINIPSVYFHLYTTPWSSPTFAKPKIYNNRLNVYTWTEVWIWYWFSDYIYTWKWLSWDVIWTLNINTTNKNAILISLNPDKPYWSLSEYIWSWKTTTKWLLHLNWNSFDLSWNWIASTTWWFSYTSYKIWLAWVTDWVNYWWRWDVFGVSSNFTISVLIKRKTNVWDSCILSKATSSRIKPYSLRIMSWWNIEFVTWDWVNFERKYTSTNILLDNVWYLITITYTNNDSPKMYLDWNEITYTKTGSYNPPADWSDSIFRIWREYTSSEFYWNVDEIIIENTAWSAEKVKKYYTMTKWRFWIL